MEKQKKAIPVGYIMGMGQSSSREIHFEHCIGNFGSCLSNDPVFLCY